MWLTLSNGEAHRRARANRKRKRTSDEAKPINPARFNRELATLRRLLRMAHAWRGINGVPRIRPLRGERNRTVTLSQPQERLYLEIAKQPLKDAALLMVDTGLRVGEVLGLEWPNVHLEPVGRARFSFIHVRRGKSLNAARNVSLTPHVRATLLNRQASRTSVWVFTDGLGFGSISIYTLEAQHKRMRGSLGLPADAVIHSFRHTFGARLGEAGAGAFEIMRAMGHSTVTVSQRYMHPTPEAMERAFRRLEAMNAKARAGLRSGKKRHLPTTISTTVQSRESKLASHGI